jgi:D-ribose pyranase
MKRKGLLNPDLSRAVARLGHTDQVCVADCGLPIPAGVPVVDLALVFGIPRFEEVLEALLAEIVVESATIATEARGTAAEATVSAVLARHGHSVVVDDVGHENLKHAVRDCAFVIRTGEATPWANVVLHCGVPF